MNVNEPLGRDPEGGAATGGAVPGPMFRGPDVETEEAPRGLLPGVLRFFLVPLLLVGASLAVFAGLGALVAQGPPGPEELVRQIAEGGKNSRWQAAQELSNQVARGDLDLRRDERLTGDVASAFRKARADADDPRIVQYLSRLLGKSASEDARSALEEALADGNPDVRIYAGAALAEMAHLCSTDPLVARLQDLDPGVRTMAAYAVPALLEKAGVSGHPEAAAALVRALEDPVVDVRWNAALGLARLGRAEGADLLWRMLHRDYVRASLRKGDGAGLGGFLTPAGADPATPGEIEDGVVRNALSAVWRLKDRSMIEGVRALAASDPDPGVQDWALRAKDLLEREVADRGAVAARTWTAAEAR